MTYQQPITATNDQQDKIVEIVCDCDFLWSLAQQFSYVRLSDQTGENQYRFINLYAARARRIAATYARFYLETEDGGDSSKRGRYYWMALGAFASKTVACLLDSFQLNASYFIGKLGYKLSDMEEIANGLGKGNLWLFGDIAPAHWFYNHYPQNFFDGMACLHKRHANTLVEPVKKALHDLPWAENALPRVDHFKSSEDLIKGFKYVVQIEKMTPSKKREKTQLDHLLAIADHEQGAVLQPLIYDDPVFRKWTARERHWLVHWAAPRYELVFAHQCATDDLWLKSIAPDNMVVEDFKSRMGWIEKAAKKFHGLMQEQEKHMLTELQTIAGWVNAPDARWVY